MSKTLKNWRARPSNGKLTIYGENPDGSQARITGVVEIRPCGGICLATDANTVHTLVCR